MKWFNFASFFSALSYFTLYISLAGFFISLAYFMATLTNKL